MSTKLWLPLAVSVALVISACSGSGKTRSDADAVTQTNAAYSDNIAPVPTPTQDDESFDASMQAERNLTTNLIYFDFDEVTIKQQYMTVVDAYAAYLNATPTARIRLEGHADERGTREYNMGLGERRAIAVESALLSKGVSPAQLSVISYGEERPVDVGHNEQGWALNRRVQLVKQ